jgi:hypothetical protein
MSQGPEKKKISYTSSPPDITWKKGSGKKPPQPKTGLSVKAWTELSKFDSYVIPAMSMDLNGERIYFTYHIPEPIAVSDINERYDITWEFKGEIGRRKKGILELSVYGLRKDGNPNNSLQEALYASLLSQEGEWWGEWEKDKEGKTRIRFFMKFGGTIYHSDLMPEELIRMYFKNIPTK